MNIGSESVRTYTYYKEMIEKEYLDVISDKNIDAVVACKIGGRH